MIRNDNDRHGFGSLSPSEEGEWDMIQKGIAGLPGSQVSEMDLQRLRRRVRREVLTGHSHNWGTRIAVVAAAVCMAAFGLFAAGGAGLTDSAAGTSFDVVRVQDGSILIQFHDQGAARSVRKAAHPAALAQTRMEYAGRGRYIDSDHEMEPGTAVFYRID